MSIVKEPFEQMNGLALFHTANQPITRRNHCAEFGCSHICTLTKSSARCMCPVGMYLDRRNKRSCTGNNNNKKCHVCLSVCTHTFFLNSQSSLASFPHQLQQHGQDSADECHWWESVSRSCDPRVVDYRGRRDDPI
jgi:hypothetical protein